MQKSKRADLTYCRVTGNFVGHLRHPVTCLDQDAGGSIDGVDGSVQVKILVASEAHVVLVVSVGLRFC